MLEKIVNFAKKFALKTPVIIQAPMAGEITSPQRVAQFQMQMLWGALQPVILRLIKWKQAYVRLKN